MMKLVFCSHIHTYSIHPLGFVSFLPCLVPDKIVCQCQSEQALNWEGYMRITIIQLGRSIERLYFVGVDNERLCPLYPI